MKVYDQAEIAAILEKAANNSAQSGPTTSMGLTLDELRTLAADAGIDPDAVNKAVAEIDREVEPRESTFWGGPFSFNSQIVVDGEVSVAQIASQPQQTAKLSTNSADSESSRLVDTDSRVTLPDVDGESELDDQSGRRDRSRT